jgi:hypothetical protein
MMAEMSPRGGKHNIASRAAGFESNFLGSRDMECGYSHRASSEMSGGEYLPDSFPPLRHWGVDFLNFEIVFMCGCNWVSFNCCSLTRTTLFWLHWIPSICMTISTWMRFVSSQR